MISISQAVQSLATTSPAASVQLSRTALIAAALPPASGEIVSLDTAPQEPLLYTASGLLTTTVANSTTSGNSVAEPAVDTLTAPAPAAAPTATTNAPPAGIATAEPAATGALGLPATAENTGTEAVATITPLAVDIFVDPAARALADFTANPIHGHLATAININAAIYRMAQFSSAALVSAIDVPEPVTPLTAINVDVADLNQRSAERPTGDGYFVPF